MCIEKPVSSDIEPEEAHTESVSDHFIGYFFFIVLPFNLLLPSDGQWTVHGGPACEVHIGNFTL